MPENRRIHHGRIAYLDGLRAYSIVLVLMGHAVHLIPWMSSRLALPLTVLFTDSTLGVRVFFVLSGFLITALLLDEFEDTHTISIKGFYERRIARIFPVFYAYILAIVALKLLDLAKVGWPAIVAAATYTWNYSILWGAPIGNSGYLLGHFWTLSLEEQFYLVWPALLFLVGPRRARQTALAAVLLLPVLRVASYFLLPSLRGQLGMMFHTGADQILWGALGAFAYRDGVLERVRNSRYRGAIPWL